MVEVVEDADEQNKIETWGAYLEGWGGIAKVQFTCRWVNGDDDANEDYFFHVDSYTITMKTRENHPFFTV